MAESIAIVLEVEGEVWARSADGDMRLLQAGDAVHLGETVVTAANARVNLEFSSGDTVQLAGGQTLPMSAEMLAEGEPSAEEQAVTDPGVQEVLALLEGDGDLLEQLEEAAAGTAGGDAGGGRTIVQVTRIVEQIDPLAFDFAGPNREPNEPEPGVTGATVEEEAEPVEPAEPEAPLPDISVNLDDQNGETIYESLISGTTTNVEAGQTVFLEVTDGENTVTTSAIVQPDGSYQVYENLSSLSDGELTVTATVSNQAGDEATDTDTAILDTEAAATITIDTIAGDDVINAEESEDDITITGSVGGDASEGDTVTLTIGGNTYSGEVDGDNNYAIDVPGSVLAANEQVGASVSGEDDAGNDFSASTSRPYDVDTEAAATITIDTIAGDDVINLDEVGEETSITITGSVGGDAGEGDTVTLTIDGVGDWSAEGLVDADGNYAIPVSSTLLAEFDSINASVTGSDPAGNSFSATTSRDYTVEVEGPDISGLTPDGEGSDVIVDEAFLENGTRAGEEPAAGEPGTTATGQFTLSAPAGIGTLSIAAASLISGDASFGSDLVTLTAAQLETLNDTDVVIETPEGNTLTLTGYDADTGVVDYSFELTGPVTNVDGQPLDKAPIDLTLTDANDNTDQATLNVAILDDGVDTVDDPLAATDGGTVTGNVLDNDSGADVELELQSVTFEGTTYPLPENGETITIEGDHGTLTIGRDGNYSYVANTIEPVTIDGDDLAAWEDDTAGLWGFGPDTLIPLDGDGNLLVGELGDGNDNVIFNRGSKSGVGVDEVQSGKIDDGEALLVRLDDPTDSATIGINQFNESQEEIGFWNAYDASGELVASGTFSGINSNGDRFELTIETEQPFTYLQLGMDTGEINSNAGYVVDEITSTPTRQFEQDAFTYTAVDQDGSTTEGTLSAFAFSDDLNPVIGGEDDDTLVGTEGDDALAGGAGDDTLTGDLGDDVFKWTLADQGDTDDPANDVITDFGEGTNVLDLRDLLVDESEQTITDFLSVEEDGDDLLFQVTYDGGTDGVTQTIRLEGMSFSDFGANDGAEVIQNMLDNGQLDIDT